MKNLLPALATKISGSALASDVGGRIWFEEYQDDGPAVYPYVIYFIVDSNPDNVFNKKGKDTILQFSIFSASKSAVEITNIYADLMALFDECSMTITGNTLALCAFQNLVPIPEEVTTEQGTTTIKHWAVDFNIVTQET